MQEIVFESFLIVVLPGLHWASLPGSTTKCRLVTLLRELELCMVDNA